MNRRQAADLALFVVPCGALLGFVLWRSLGWRMHHDLPMMMYQAFLMDRFGFVPYRDFFDMNMPGTYATYFVLGKVLGYGDGAMRVADLACMAAIAGIAVGILRRGTIASAILAPILFLLTYLRFGGEITLQRELLALVPIGLGVLAALSEGPARRRALLAGLAFGVAATYKPPLAIGALPVAVSLAAEVLRGGGSRGEVARIVGLGTLGLVAPFALALAVLWPMGALDDFLGGLEYLRYYSMLTGGHKTIEGPERTAYLVEKVVALGDHPTRIAVGALGYAFAMGDDVQRRRTALLGGLLAVYTVYPAFSGQFWPYHWLPAWFFAALGVASLLTPDGAWGPWVARRLAVLLVVARITRLGEGLEPWDPLEEHHPSRGRPDKIAAYLREHLRPGDTVQPFDWVLGGVAQGLLLAEARPATPFLYTFHFYHHVDEPYIQSLRGRFGRDLLAARPAYVVVSRVHWPFVRGEHTSEKFPGFDAWLEKNYVLADDFDVKDVEMWERKDLYSR